jgi:methionyl aminopeptidase
MKLLDIAEKIESKIRELGAKPAFPVNLSINEIAAHSTPSYNDEQVAWGLLKIDLGIHVKGFIADTAFSINMEKNEEYDKLIKASKEALENAAKILKPKMNLSEIGRVIQQTIQSYNFSPIINLSGHSLESYNIHAGITIPNYENKSQQILEIGAYAIEPFATSGIGLVIDGKPSGIYRLEARKGIRDSLARKILDYIEEEYKNFPFAQRWIVKKFGARALFSLANMEQSGILYQYPQLIEKSHKEVSQAEHTILVSEKIEITT